MFTYLVEDRILFSCDFYGTHTVFGTYDDEVPEAVQFAKRYFGEIMMPFRNMGAKGLEKTKKREVKLIAPSHGPIWKDPQRILEPYSKWTAGQTEKKVVVAYVSMHYSTDAMVKAMTETLLSEGVEVTPFNLVTADIGDLARELVDARAVVLGAPTVLGGMHPLGVYAAYLVKALRPPLKLGAIVSSYGWSGGALKQAGEILGPTGIEVVGVVDINGPPTDADFAKVAEVGKALAAKMAG
jgi:flavorubredoxin